MNNSMHKKPYQLILARDIDDQRPMLSDWTRGLTGYIQPKVIVHILPSLDD